MSSNNGKQSFRQGGTATVITPDQGGYQTGRGERWQGKASTYYNIPLIQKAHWGWEIVLYFFLGGMAGGSFLISTIADLFGSDEDATLVRAGRYLSFVCILISPILLIKDLGRPERFLHMLRVLKLRSVMSIGIWVLIIFSLLSGFTTAYQAAQDGLFNWFPLMARLIKSFPVKVIESIGSVFGIIVATYTGVLLAATAVPVWARARNILGGLFFTSGLSTALSALALILSLGRSNKNQGTLERVERAELIAATTELSLIATLPSTLGPLSKPIFKGRTGIFFLGGTIASGLVVPLFLRLGWKVVGKPTPRNINIIASLLVLAGGLILRYVWIVAGRESADDPEATHYYNKIEWEKR